MLVGEESRGWDLIVDQLNHERVTLGPAGNLGHTDRYSFVERRGETRAGRAAVIEEPGVRRAVAACTPISASTSC